MIPSVIPLISLLSVTCLLAVFGAGVFPLVTYIATLALLLTVFFIHRHLFSIRNSRTVFLRVPYPILVSFIAIILLSITIMPWFFKSDILTGNNRYEQNNIVRKISDEGSKLKIISTHQSSFAISRNKSGTYRILLMGIMALCAAILSSSLTSKNKSIYINCLISFGTIFAVLGFINQWILPADQRIWWVFKIPHGHPVGPFINRTHFGGYVAMFASLALARLLSRLRTRQWAHVLIYAASFLIMSMVVIFSQSRGALISLCLCTFTIWIVYVYKKKVGIAIGSLITIIICSIIIVGIISNLPQTRIKTAIISRIASLRHPLDTYSAHSRLHTWRDTLSIFHAYPLIGGGANSFRTLFPQYRTSSDRQSHHHAENEYVEFLSDTGIAGVLLALVFLYSIIFTIRRNLHTEELPPDILLCVIATSIVVCIHNGLDFPLHTPLYTMTYASILGLIMSPTETSEKREKQFYISSQKATVATISLSCVLCASFLITGRMGYRIDSRDTLNTASADTACRALYWAPTQWEAWYRLATLALEREDLASAQFAVKCLRYAVHYDPNNYITWEALGHACAYIQDKQGEEEAFQKMHALRSWKTIPVIKDDKY